VKLEVFEDHTRQILAKNDSPDVGFTFSVNPYRGCFHACAYCYARPSHEYLSLGAGTDFDRKIVVKLKAAELLRAAFARKSWRKETVVFSGVTDCYQPLEASYRLTRVEVCVAHANSAIITKSALIGRASTLVELPSRRCSSRSAFRSGTSTRRAPSSRRWPRPSGACTSSRSWRAPGCPSA
jgi:DNA repair photolyase